LISHVMTPLKGFYQIVIFFKTPEIKRQFCWETFIWKSSFICHLQRFGDCLLRGSI